MADGEETHLPSSSYRISCTWWGFVMKGSGFVWSGQAQRPSSLLTLIINIIKETNNFTIEAWGQLVLSMWGSLSLSEIAWENKKCYFVLDISVQFSHSVMSNSLQPHGLQHARLPCLSPTPGACSNSRPSSLWCHPTERVTGRKVRGLQTEEIGWKCQTFFLSLLSGWRNKLQVLRSFPLLYTNLKRGFS